ncbi:hypothetical protein A7985_22295 [Pseudoalteromonas luteoviolacea]|uniref:SPOR domain-containing protein n=1 Tax=Pseudoalteromonas luteoviolacea TaxID=43657 RepID=A0A1C0TKQ7_9GAMM|nr:hypothetical protein [Pseudoalteromonas luteoviolacea]MBQ4813983.1 hypothetical protein [Pseudoalteromonas luteoviolacea]OCQ18923.1 hypothetical protein A7985_22295 [Pseudoalteromonas luteoviolacea]
MPTSLWPKKLSSVLPLLGLFGCANTELSLEEKLAQQEAIHAHKSMIASYDKNKASIERLAQMEGDLSQLLAVLSVEAEVTTVQNHVSPVQETTVHTATDFIEPQSGDFQTAATTNIKSDVEVVLPDLVLGIHIKRDHALRQVEHIDKRLSMVKQQYHLVFRTVHAQLIEPSEQQHLYYVTAKGFTSKEEAEVFCKAMTNIAKRCTYL